MPSVSEAQHKAMEAAAHGHSTLGIPEKVGKEFVNADKHRSDDGTGRTELDVAKGIQSGELGSPQQYENIWLFDVRITGTGTAYRPAHEEVVYRPPENFLTEEFMQRCNGLPLIFEHPEKSILTTEEYRNRSIGTVILPYIKGDEVWGIAKVFDADAAQLMQTTHASTSPAVVFRDAGSTETLEVDGQTVLIEGKPSYLDHLAICEVGVWDKGGEPSGVSITGESLMDEHEEKVPAWADALMKRMDSMHSRMDAYDKGRVDSEKEEEKKDCAEADARKDSEEEAKTEKRQAEELEKLAKEEREEGKREEEKKDSKRADESKSEEAEKEERKKDGEFERKDSVSRAEVDALRAQLANLTKPLTGADRDALAAAQSRADSVSALFGQEASAPLHGETPIAYRKRLAAKFQKHSTKVAGVKLDSLDGAAFDLVEDQIYADAMSFARSPEQRRAGMLIPITRRDAAGRNVTTYEGDMDSWLQHFKSPGQGVRINRVKEA